MKKIISTCLLLVSLSPLAQANPALLCSLSHSKRVIAIAERHSDYDKNRHCSVSCMMALKCNDDEVRMVGFLKEVKDFFGPGECSEDDLKADLIGVNLAATRAAKTDSQCLSQCDLYFAP